MQAPSYTGPDFHLIRSLDDWSHEVTNNHGKRIGVYHSIEMAQRVAKGCDKTALRDHLKALRKAQRGVRC